MGEMGTVKPIVKRNRDGSTTKLYLAQDAQGRVLGTYERYSVARLVASGVMTPREAGK